MHFAHCDHDETYISLHDCVAERAWFENSKLGFAFKDGFYVSPDHPESNLSTMVLTDLSHAEFTLSPDEGANYDVSVCFFKKTLFGRTLKIDWTVQQLVDNINAGKCSLEFLYQYLDGNSRIIECVLHFPKRPYYCDCLLKIESAKVCYYWNSLCEDKPW